MDRATWMRFFEASPEPVQWYLLDEQAIKAEDLAQEKLGYDHDAWVRVMEIVWDQIFLRIPEVEFRKRLMAVTGDRDPREVERLVLRYVVLPLADLVPWDVERRLQELGFALGDIQSVNRVSLRPMSYGAAVRRIAAQAKVTLLSEEMVKRCRDILVSFLKGVRVIDQVKEILGRSQPEGGVGFTPAQVDAFVTQMVDFLEKTQVISEQEYADWFSAFQRQIESDRITGRKEADPSAEPMSEDKLPKSAFTSPKAREAQAALAEATEATYAATGWNGQDEYLVRRLQNIISTRLRDVRNAIQVKEILARETKVGGMGLPPEEVERIANTIEDEYARRRASIVEEEKAKILEVQRLQEQKIAERKTREAQEHAEWFEKKVRSAQQADEARRAFFEQMRAVATGRVQKPVDTTSNAPAPTLDPVSPPVRLVGLTEELEEIGLENFRRMARSPHDAAQKIIQQLDALKSESFERWTEGVQAWRSSPLQQLYLSLVGESFRAGRSVVELIEEKRKVNPDMLTAEEVGGILEVNAHAQL